MIRKYIPKKCKGKADKENRYLISKSFSFCYRIIFTALILIALVGIGGCSSRPVSCEINSLAYSDSESGYYQSNINTSSSETIDTILLFQKDIHGITGLATYDIFRVCTDYIYGNNSDFIIELDSDIEVFVFIYNDLSDVPLYNLRTWNGAVKQVYSLFEGLRYRFVFKRKADIKIDAIYVMEHTSFLKARLGTEIPSYYEEEIETKIQDIINKKSTDESKSDSFVFITDTHFLDNRLHSPALIKKITKETGIDFIVNGGDIVSSADFIDEVEEAENQIKMWKSLIGGEYIIRGNHDHDVLSNGSLIITDESFYNLCVKRNDSNPVFSGQLYYHIDHPSSKIRYIFMDSGDSTITALDNKQLQWLEDRLTELSSEWSVVIFQHIAILERLSIEGIADTSLSKFGLTLNNAILEAKAHMKAELVAVVCGHSHRDSSLIKDGTLFVSTTCDHAGIGNNPYDSSYPTRTLDSVLEQAFDVCTIDKSSKKIFFTRIGAGNDREFTYITDVNH